MGGLGQQVRRVQLRAERKVAGDNERATAIQAIERDRDLGDARGSADPGLGLERFTRCNADLTKLRFVQIEIGDGVLPSGTGGLL